MLDVEVAFHFLRLILPFSLFSKSPCTAMKTSYQLVALATILVPAVQVLAQGKSYDFSAPPSDPNPAPTTVIVSVIEESPVDVTVTIDEPSGGFPTYTPPPPQSVPAASSSAPVAAPVPTPASSSPASAAKPSHPAAPSQPGGTISTNGTNPTCGPNCAMSVSFTGMNVPFAVGAGQANIMSGMTREVCLCFEPGATRAVIGTTDTGKMATLFEGSASSGGDGYLDVSYVQGYTYPMVCSGQGGTSGCSTDLYSVPGAKCPGGGGTKMGDTCNNPQGPAGKRNPGAPPANGNSPTADPWCQACSAPDRFFAPCAGRAYTYPYDDVAMASGTEITCCIGPQCKQKQEVSSNADKGNCDAGDVAIRKDPCTPCPGTNSCTAPSSKKGHEQVFKRAGAEKRSVSHLKRHKHRHAGAHSHQH